MNEWMFLSNSDILEYFMNVDDDDFTYVIYNIFIHKQQIAIIFLKREAVYFWNWTKLVVLRSVMSRNNIQVQRFESELKFSNWPTAWMSQVHFFWTGLSLLDWFPCQLNVLKFRRALSASPCPPPFLHPRISKIYGVSPCNLTGMKNRCSIFRFISLCYPTFVHPSFIPGHFMAIFAPLWHINPTP